MPFLTNRKAVVKIKLAVLTVGLGVLHANLHYGSYGMNIVQRRSLHYFSILYYNRFFDNFK